MLLQDRVAIVTGGGRGIGRQHCLELARQGARVLVNDPGVGLRGEAEPDAAPGSPADDVAAAILAAGGVAIADHSSVTALEMHRFHVSANAISPVAATRMTPNATRAGNDDWDSMDPANSSPLVAYLASEHSGWLTGQVLRVEGNVVRRARTWTLEPDEYVAASGTRLDASELVEGMRRLYGAMPAGLQAPKALGLG